MSLLLRNGLLVAAAITLVGGAIFLGRHGTEVPHLAVFHGEPADLRSVGGVIEDVLSGRGRGLIQLGLLLLVATPVARVAFSLAAFLVQRDLLYVTFTLVVLTLLLLSLFGVVV